MSLLWKKIGAITSGDYFSTFEAPEITAREKIIILFLWVAGTLSTIT